VQADEVMEKSSAINSPIVALRFNSISIDYNKIAGKPVLTRSINIKECAVRLDICESLLLELFYVSN
jgi:hypothetical protein